MVKRLGIPTWFMTLSCADLRWPELFQIIAKIQGEKMANEELDAFSYNERCQMLNMNPVIVAKHFQYRVETFFSEVFLSKANPIGKVEFQMRGSPHLHALIWTLDCPKMTDDNKQAYIDYIDQHVQASLMKIWSILNYFIPILYAILFQSFLYFFPIFKDYFKGTFYLF